MQLAPLLSVALLVSTPCAQAPGPPVAWTTLQPKRAWSTQGARLSVDPGGAISVPAEAPARDVHLVEVHTDLAEITGFRLEVLGPGTGKGGLFRLAELGLSVAPAHRPRRAAPTVLVHAAGTSKHAKHPVYHTIDNNTRSDWHGTAADPVALFECAAPILHKRGSRLLFSFEYYGRDRATLGKFRLSATADPHPLRELGHPLSKDWPATQKRINAAIDRGVQTLIAQQERDGSWKQYQDSYPAGQTALSLYTLLKSGVSGSAEPVQRALAFLEAHPAQKTYSTSVQILALCAAGVDEHRAAIQRSVRQLVSWQRRGYGYPGGNVDLSNTQYAALALREAARHGFAVPDSVWPKLLKQTLQNQQSKGAARTGPASFPLGFSYRPNQEPTGSMTAAGLTILAICREQMGAPPALNAALERGLAWMAVNFCPTANTAARKPFEHHRALGHLYYYLYGLERLGGLLDQHLFGPHDWYRKGARFLLATQQANGRWRDQTNTCFALLFLVRATRETARGPATGVSSGVLAEVFGTDNPDAPLSIRAGGQVPMTIWVSSFGSKTHDDHEWSREGGRGPRVAKVDYYAAPVGRPKKLIASVPGDPEEPAHRTPFSAQHEFEEFGYYTITAKVTVMSPPAEGAKSKPVVLDAPGVEVLVRDPKERMTPEELQGYATDPLRNLLASAKVKARASTQRKGSWGAGLAVDNLHARGWMSDAKDERPWLDLELGRPARANLVLLSPVHDYTAARPPTTAAFKRVRLRINGGRAHDVVMAVDPRRKTRLQLPRPQIVRRIHIEIFDRTGRDIGLAEVELQLHK